MKTKTVLMSLISGLAVAYVGVCIGVAQMPPRTISRQQSTNPKFLQRKAARAKLIRDAYWVWHHDKNLPEAERLFRKALQLDTSSDDAWVSLARIMDEQGREKEALAFYDGLLGPHRWTSSLQHDRAILARYAELCDKFGRSPEALQAYQQILQESGQTGVLFWGDTNMTVRPDAQTPDELRARAYLLMGLAHQSHNEGYLYTEPEMANRAINAYREAVRLAPDLAIAHYYLGYGLQQAGRKAEATAEFARAEQVGDEAFRTAMHKRENDALARTRAAERTERSVTVSVDGKVTSNTPSVHNR